MKKNEEEAGQNEVGKNEAENSQEQEKDKNIEQNIKDDTGA